MEARSIRTRSGGARAAAAAVQRGPEALVVPVAVMLAAAFAAAFVILSVVPDDGPQRPMAEWVRGISAGLCALVGIGLLAWEAGGKRRWGSRGARDHDTGVAALMLSGGLMAILLLVPVYLLAASNHPPKEDWIGYGFFDKRWLVATFTLGTLGTMVLVAAVAQLVRAAATAPATWREWAVEAFGPARIPLPRLGMTSLTLVRSLALIGGAVALAAYFFAPPWHTALSEVNIHETPMMAGVQGIANGAVPYIGEGAVQYGPGSELIHYFYLQAAGWDLESLRESTVLLFWLAATIFFVTTFLRLPARLALIACLLAALLFPTLAMVSFQPDGSVDAAVDRLRDSEGGVWGWPNALRYVGIFCLAMLLPAVATIRERGRATAAAVGLGALWGLTCFISQENLLGGVLVVGTVSLLLAITRTVPTRALLQALFRLAAGFAVVAAAVLGFYASQGELGRFLELYFLIPPAVAAGYSATVFYEGISGPWGVAYHLLPFFLGALCLAAMVRLHPLRIAREWSPERVLLVSALVAACVMHSGSLLRADPPHLINTMLALPVAVVLAVAYLPKLLGIESRGRRRLTAVALAVIPVALMPLVQIREVPDRVTSPLARFSYESPALEWQRIDQDSLAAQRLTPEVVRRPGQWCCTFFRYGLSMREFGVILNRIHKVVGDRRVYVANFIDELHPGGAYFLADLRPAPILFEPLTMAMNQDLLDEFLAHFREHVGEVEAIVAVYPNLPEVEMFKRAHPGYEETRIPYSWGSITVLTD